MGGFFFSLCGLDDEDFERWEPLPADASLEESVSCGSGVGSGDPLARLFDIYGSREVFADEYRKMLGTKLIFSEEVGGEVDREIRNVEMLKVRFGSEAMQNCAVMLKDVADTRRIISAANKASAEDDKPNSEFIIISRVSKNVPSSSDEVHLHRARRPSSTTVESLASSTLLL